MTVTEAPELFEYDDSSHCFVKSQPANGIELQHMLSAIECAELDCIRYRGTDRTIQLQIVEQGNGNVCDDLPADLQTRSDEIRKEMQEKWEQELKSRSIWSRLLSWIIGRD